MSNAQSTDDRVAALETALRGLYWDNVDYLTLNKLGGMNNHWMRAAREALGMDPNDLRPSFHAEGPWEVGERNGCYAPINAPNWYSLATVVVRIHGEERDSQKGLANARLIAAAPDLLAALKRLVATVKPDALPHDKGCGCVVHEARAAIAKAEGRTHE